MDQPLFDRSIDPSSSVAPSSLARKSLRPSRSTVNPLIPSAATRMPLVIAEVGDAIKRKRGTREEWRYSITPKTTAWEAGVRNNTKQTASGGGY